MRLLLLLLLAHDKSGEAILRRNIFCSSCGPPPPSLKLIARIETREPRWSFAVVRDGDRFGIVPLSVAPASFVVAERSPKAVRPPPMSMKDLEQTAIRDLRIAADPKGLRITFLRRDSPFERLGLRRGDVVQAVNGCVLDSADHALDCWTRLRRARHFSAALLRDGTTVTVDYDRPPE